jgi:hypothetical protein
MKKLFLVLVITVMVFSCKKEKSPTPSPGPTAHPAWNGLYCISFFNEPTLGVYDTIGHECGSDSSLSYYSGHPNPYNATYAAGTRIYNCSECN